MNIDDMQSAITELQRQMRDLQAQAGAGSTTVGRGVLRVAPGGGLNVEGQSNFSGRADFVGDVNFSGPTSLAGDTFIANMFSGTQWITPSGSNFTQPMTVGGTIYALGGMQFANLTAMATPTDGDILLIDGAGNLRIGPSYAPPGSGGGGMGGGGSTFQWPFDRAQAGDLYGLRDYGDGFHNGIDWAKPGGEPIRAAGSGVISQSGWGTYSGNYVRIEHGTATSTGLTLATEYWHMNAPGLGVGTAVSMGTVIGYVGTTGDSTGNHLHWQTHEGGPDINPDVWMPRYQDVLRT